MSEDIVIEPISSLYLARLVDCVTTVWVEDNVIAQTLGVTREGYRPLAERLCRQALADEMALVLRDRAADRIVGFYTAIDLVDELDAVMANVDDANPRVARWSRFLAVGLRWYTGKYHADTPLERGQVAYHNIGGTVRELRHRKWAGRLAQRGMPQFSTGFERAIAIATHPHSVAWCEALGVTDAHRIPFADVDDPDLRQIVEPAYALVAVQEVASISELLRAG